MKSKIQTAKLLTIMFSTFLLFACSNAIAMTSGIADKKTVFDMTFKIFIDGKLITSPRIVACANQLASIDSFNKSGAADLKINLVARNAAMPGNQNAIGINFDVQYKDGEEKMHSKPTFFLWPNQEGNIKFSSKTGHVYEIDVVAKRA